MTKREEVHMDVAHLMSWFGSEIKPQKLKCCLYLKLLCVCVGGGDQTGRRFNNCTLRSVMDLSGMCGKPQEAGSGPLCEWF